MAPKAGDYRYVTGFCQNGFHEGQRLRNYRGEPMASCRGQWSTHLHGVHTQHSCACECHEVMTQVMLLDKKVVSRLLKGIETGMELEFLADMCDVKVEFIEAVKSVAETVAGLDWEPGERVWPESGKWWRDDDDGIQPVEAFVRPWDDPKWNVSRSRPEEEVLVITANQRDQDREVKGELTPNQMRVRRAIKVGILPPNPDYVETGRRSSSSVDERALIADSLKQQGLTLREDALPGGDEAEPEVKGVRTAGQLEREVKEVCDIFVIGLMPDVDQLTCAEIARAINVDNPPSTGAITNVLKRWNEVGFAVHETGPHRFGGYTPEGIELGVNEMYARVGRSARGAATRARHSFHRRR